MFYDFAIVVPANTPASAPHIVVLPLTHGVINSVRLDFKHGTDHLVHVVLNRGLKQVYPTNEDGDFNLDGVYCSFEDFYKLTAEPFELTVRAWSPGTTYPHTVDVQIGLIESEIALAFYTLLGAFGKFFKLVGIQL